MYGDTHIDRRGDDLRSSTVSQYTDVKVRMTYTGGHWYLYLRRIVFA